MEIKYYNQYYDVTDIPETKKDERLRTCNVTCVAMIVGKHPDIVLKEIWDEYGINDKFQWEGTLISYLEKRGFNCFPITELAWPKSRHVTKSELQMMCRNLENGHIILYHKEGHYQLLVDYELDDHSEVQYIFNDPAGNRLLPISSRKRESGHEVRYSEAFVLSEKIYGRCWAVKGE